MITSINAIYFNAKHGVPILYQKSPLLIRQLRQFDENSLDTRFLQSLHSIGKQAFIFCNLSLGNVRCQANKERKRDLKCLLL